jgi:hypothetical protein
MAKKQASKKCKFNLWYCATALLALVAIVMAFTTCVKLNGVLTGTTDYTGLQATFGYTDKYDNQMFAFSFVNLITYLLLLAGFVLVLLKAFGTTKSKTVDYVVIALFLVAAILFFLMPTLAVSPYADNANKILAGSVTRGLGVGAILSAILLLCSAFTLLVKTLLKK